MTSKGPVPVARLEQLLSVWEQTMWGLKIVQPYLSQLNPAIAAGFPKTSGAITHHADFRRYLLSLQSMDDYDLYRFSVTGGADTDSAFNKMSPQWTVQPQMLAGWVTSSRRVYNLDADLQALLGATSLKDLAMADLRQPFPSFGISLAEPIRDAAGAEHDFILWSMVRYKDTDSFVPAIAVFSKKLGKFKPLSNRAVIQRKADRGNVMDAGKMIMDSGCLLEGIGVIDGALLSPSEVVLVTDALEVLDREGSDSTLRQATQIAIGLGLYLKMLPATSPHVSEWNYEKGRLLGSLDHRAITDEAHVCSVSSTRKLSAEDRAMLFAFASGRGDYELSAHFRIGFWHRPRGKGQDPTYPKTEWTHPTIVRRDRLPEGGLPGGSQVDLS